MVRSRGVATKFAADIAMAGSTQRAKLVTLTVSSLLALAAGQFGSITIDWHGGEPTIKLDEPIDQPQPSAPADEEVVDLDDVFTASESRAPPQDLQDEEVYTESATTQAEPTHSLEQNNLMLFILAGHHLFPHTRTSIHFFEPRYKLMVQRALASDRQIGILSADGIGTLGTINEINEMDQTGRVVATLTGSSRFVVGRQWAEECEDCPHPLVHGDVTFFNETEPEASDPEEVLAAGVLAKDALSRYRRLVRAARGQGSDVHSQLQNALGPLPSAHGPHGAYAVSMWLSGACTAIPACSSLTEGLLRGRSTSMRLKQIIAFQEALEEAQLRGSSSTGGGAGGT